MEGSSFWGGGGKAGDGRRLRGEAARNLGGGGSIILNNFERGGWLADFGVRDALSAFNAQETKVFCFFFSKKKCFLPSS